MPARILSFLAVLFLAACQQSAPVKLETAQFTGPQFGIRASDIEVSRATQDSPADIQARYDFPTRLDTGMEKWSQDRLQLRGGENTLKLTIKQAEVTEQALPVTDGLKGLFKNEQEKRYNAKLKVELSLYTPDRYTPRVGVEAESSATATVPEGASPAERKQVFNKLVLDTLRQMDAELSRRIPQYFGNYLEAY